jgi:hypothetical protein
MMRFTREILALLLVEALLLATGAWAGTEHGFVSSVESPTNDRSTSDHSTNDHAANDYAAGCHGFGGKNPTDSQVPDSSHPRRPVRQPAPVRYRCCLTGHDVATVQASYALQPLAMCERAVAPIDPALDVHFPDGGRVSTILFADPPGMPTLRI